MRVLLFTLEYPPFHGGVANYYGNLVKFWPDKNNIHVLHNNQNRLINKTWPILKWLPSVGALRTEIKNKGINQVLVGNILPLGLAAYIIFLFLKINYSVVIHGTDFSFAKKTLRKRLLLKLILNKASKIITANSYTEKLVKNFLPLMTNKIFTVNPGINPVALNNENLINKLIEKYNLKNKVIMLSVGRLVKRKGFINVIKALPKVLLACPDLIYVILGNGQELKNLKLEIKNLKLADNVIIITEAGDEEKNYWYKLCDFFIMAGCNIAGDYEGFGITYLEANSAGKAVIAGLSGGVSDAVINNLNGLMINPENNEEIVKSIIKLSLNKELRDGLGDRGRERAINEFNWPGQVIKFNKIIIS